MSSWRNYVPSQYLFPARVFVMTHWLALSYLREIYPLIPNQQATIIVHHPTTSTSRTEGVSLFVNKLWRFQIKPNRFFDHFSFYKNCEPFFFICCIKITKVPFRVVNSNIEWIDHMWQNYVVRAHVHVCQSWPG